MQLDIIDEPTQSQQWPPAFYLVIIDRITLVKWFKLDSSKIADSGDKSANHESTKLESTNRQMDTRMLPNIWPHCYAVDKKNPKRQAFKFWVQ